MGKFQIKIKDSKINIKKENPYLDDFISIYSPRLEGLLPKLNNSQLSVFSFSQEYTLYLTSSIILYMGIEEQCSGGLTFVTKSKIPVLSEKNYDKILDKMQNLTNEELARKISRAGYKLIKENTNLYNILVDFFAETGATSLEDLALNSAYTTYSVLEEQGKLKK